MNDLYTLLTLRDEVYAEHKHAVDSGDSYMEADGLSTALRMIEQKIQAEVDFRDAHAPHDAVLSPTEWENMA